MVNPRHQILKDNQLQSLEPNHDTKESEDNMLNPISKRIFRGRNLHGA